MDAVFEKKNNIDSLHHLSGNMKKITFKDTEWPQKSAIIIADQIRAVLLTKKDCSVFLTGGRGAERVYTFLSEELRACKGINHFYLGDERCVPDSHADSNYRMIVNTLFPAGIGNGQKLYKMYDAADTPETAAEKYESILPARPDIIILGLGDDGHIASLFPRQSWIEENNKKVISTISPVNGLQRVTITKKVIESADEIIVIASGKGKMKVLAELADNSDIAAIPARMAIKGLWLLDESAGEEIH